MESKVTYFLLLFILLLEEVCSQRRSTYAAEDSHSEVDYPKPPEDDNSTLVAYEASMALSLENSLEPIFRSKRFISPLTTIAGITLEALVSTQLLSYSRNFRMTISNYLKYDLGMPRSLQEYGYISNPPQLVKPCYTEGVAGHNGYWALSGTSGIVSWRVKELSTTIIVYWSVPYYPLRCNHLAIVVHPNLSVDEPSFKKREYWFRNLYFGPDDRVDFSGSHANYCSGSHEISQSAGGIKVSGIMGTNNDAIINIKVEPLSPEHSATQEQCNKQEFPGITSNSFSRDYL